MLDSQPELPQHVLGNVQRTLADKIHPHALGANQAHHLLDFLQQGLGRAIKQKMRLVEKQNQLGTVEIARLGKLLEQLGQQPKQKRRIQSGRGLRQTTGIENVDQPLAGEIATHQVMNIQRRLAKESIRALLLQHQEPPLDGAHRRAGNEPVFVGQLGRMFAHPVQHRAEILQVQQQQAMIVRDAEHRVEHAALGVIQLQQAGQKQRPHVGNRGAHWVPVLAEHVPERHRAAPLLEIPESRLANAPRHLVRCLAGNADAGQIALHVRQKDRHANAGESFRQHLQAHGLARARRSRDQPVPVGHGRVHMQARTARAANANRLCHCPPPSLPAPPDETPSASGRRIQGQPRQSASESQD